MKKFTKIGVTAVALATVALAGCTSTTSRGVNDQGQAEEIIFPSLSKSEGIKEGVFPNIQNLRKIGPGVTREDLYHLIGRPHFSEGLNAREWDYIMKFRTEINGPVTICQYKVIFDKDLKGQTFHWLPADCARFLQDAPTPAPVAKKVYNLKGDTLFKFDKSGINDMLPGGREEVDRIAAELRDVADTARMNIIGHTDRLGSHAYNARLSQARADTIRTYLVQRGFNGSNITTVGAGETQPVKECSNNMPRRNLIECLQPNRRVTIEVMGTR